MEMVALVGSLGTFMVLYTGVVGSNNDSFVAIGLAAFVYPLLTERYFFDRSSYGEIEYSQSGFQLRLAFLAAMMSATVGCTLAPIPNKYMTLFLSYLSLRMAIQASWYTWKWRRSSRPRLL
jgi:hypothetical protein